MFGCLCPRVLIGIGTQSVCLCVDEFEFNFYFLFCLLMGNYAQMYTKHMLFSIHLWSYEAYMLIFSTF